MKSNIKVDAVIVTYNRLKLLKECISAVLNQTKSINNIIVVNNSSSDGTPEYLKELRKKNEKVKIINLKMNIGGAGGFNAGLKYFFNESNSDFAWIMDDDAIPFPNTLENLVLPIENDIRFGFLASNVRWIDDSTCVMNIPRISRTWYKGTENNLINIDSASFVSLLIPRKTIEKIGFPIADFFIWGDDVEYTTRITKNGLPGYFVLDSKLIHKIYKNITTNIFQETDKNRIKRYFYDRRNNIYINKEFYGFSGVLKQIIKCVLICLRLVFSKSKYKRMKIKFVIEGTVKGFFFDPKVEKINDVK